MTRDSGTAEDAPEAGAMAGADEEWIARLQAELASQQTAAETVEHTVVIDGAELSGQVDGPHVAGRRPLPTVAEHRRL